jgi:hypothetical protein
MLMGLFAHAGLAAQGLSRNSLDGQGKRATLDNHTTLHHAEHYFFFCLVTYTQFTKY